MKRSLILATFAIALLTPALAHAFDPDTQSHPGAYSETTVDVHRAVGDLSANGVLSDYAEEMGIEREGGSLTAAAEAQLVVVRLAHGTVADNHGCEEGIVFPVGPRHLHKGERVAIRVPASLQGRRCSGPDPDPACPVAEQLGRVAPSDWPDDVERPGSGDHVERDQERQTDQQPGRPGRGLSEGQDQINRRQRGRRSSDEEVSQG